jgi:hypothetical protein
MRRMTMSTFLNCSNRIVQGETRRDAWSSFGPYSARRRAASELDRPDADDPRREYTLSIGIVCHRGESGTVSFIE